MIWLRVAVGVASVALLAACDDASGVTPPPSAGPAGPSVACIPASQLGPLSRDGVGAGQSGVGTDTNPNVVPGQSGTPADTLGTSGDTPQPAVGNGDVGTRPSNAADPLSTLDGQGGGSNAPGSESLDQIPNAC